MRLFIALVLFVTLVTTSCDTVTSTKTVTVEDKSIDSTKTYDIALVNNTKDPACGMPVIPIPVDLLNQLCLRRR
jgi:hypothetical protein